MEDKRGQSGTYYVSQYHAHQCQKAYFHHRQRARQKQVSKIHLRVVILIGAED